MARTISEIQQDIIDAKNAEPQLAALNSTSNVAIWLLWTYIVAVAIWTLENILDISQAQQTTFINDVKIHSLTWYSLYAKAFQFGDSLPWGEVVYDNMGIDPDLVAASQVVQFAAVTPVPGGLMVKVAGLTNNDLTPITDPQFAAFQAYMFRISAAGDNLYYRNEDADSLKLTVAIYYDALVLDSSGKRLDGTNDTPVKDEIDAYIKGIDFNGKLVEQDLVDALQAVEGVNIVDVQLLQTKYGSMAYVDVPADGVIPFAGYVRCDWPNDFVATYQI